MNSSNSLQSSDKNINFDEFYGYEPNTESGLRFAKWASQFSGKLFAMLTVYADESGTHDPENFTLEGAAVPVICGYVDTIENWTKFCDEWAALLKKYNVPYFHFCETRRSYRLKPENPYHLWSDEKVDDFLHDLAMIATRSAVPIGGTCSGAKAIKIGSGIEPFKRAFEEFYGSFENAMKSHWRHFNEPIDFFFEQQKDNAEWGSALI